MKLSEIKDILQTSTALHFKVENGLDVPQHFHITEVGMVTKHFIDCGGTIRKESKVNFQLWNADDTDHRLEPKKLLDIIALSENKIGVTNAEIEVEYQAETIGKYGLEHNGHEFILTNIFTACLAQDQCGIPSSKQKVALAEIQGQSCCTPGGGCC